MRYKCIGIAECCKLVVAVTFEDIVHWKEKGRNDIIARLKWFNHPQLGWILVIPKRADAQCIFLTGAKRCSIYKDRPKACGDFPESNLDFECCAVKDIKPQDRQHEQELKNERILGISQIQAQEHMVNSWIMEAILKVTK